MSKFQLKWGILATGGIAETFARDLWVEPETRGVMDIEHVVVAAASSTSASVAASSRPSTPTGRCCAGLSTTSCSTGPSPCWRRR